MAARDVILVTGAAGYIGSHVVRIAHEQGSKVLALDWQESGEWPEFPSGVRVYNFDVAKWSALDCEITGVIHCAADSLVEESMRYPAQYFHNNTINTLKFVAHLARQNPPPKFVFLSSAAVYGRINGTLVETNALHAEPCSPYGASKRAVEIALPWYQLASVALRLFNVAGAHPDGTLREDHRVETHLIPNAVDVAREKRLTLDVYGNDYDTRDGTAIRDYVHVIDVARACLFALDALEIHGTMQPINIGSGIDSTVLEVVDEVIKNLRHPVPIVMKDRRMGDPSHLVANIQRAEQMLGWRPGRSRLSTIVDDTIRSRR